MRCLYISVICLYFSSVYGEAKPQPVGTGAYAYQDSNGQRYGETFDINDEDFFGPKNGAFPGAHAEHFFPDYFKNLQLLIFQESRRALPPLPPLPPLPRLFPSPPALNRFPPFGSMSGLGFQNPNAAFAGGMAGPGFTHQVAGINPMNPGNYIASMRDQIGSDYAVPFGESSAFNWQYNVPFNTFGSYSPNMPNVNLVDRFSEVADNGQGYYGVQSSSYSSSSNINGKEYSQRGAHTLVNNNGKITEYSVTN